RPLTYPLPKTNPSYKNEVLRCLDHRRCLLGLHRLCPKARNDHHILVFLFYSYDRHQDLDHHRPYHHNHHHRCPYCHHHHRRDVSYCFSYQRTWKRRKCPPGCQCQGCLGRRCRCRCPCSVFVDSARMSEQATATTLSFCILLHLILNLTPSPSI
ncbi:hypothetical protein K457DRAFT_1013105, partial [Linnemannia elongata AG-77]